MVLSNVSTLWLWGLGVEDWSIVSYPDPLNIKWTDPNMQNVVFYVDFHQKSCGTLRGYGTDH